MALIDNVSWLHQLLFAVFKGICIRSKSFLQISLLLRMLDRLRTRALLSDWFRLLWILYPCSKDWSLLINKAEALIIERAALSII